MAPKTRKDTRRHKEAKNIQPSIDVEARRYQELREANIRENNQRIDELLQGSHNLTPEGEGSKRQANRAKKARDITIQPKIPITRILSSPDDLFVDSVSGTAFKFVSSERIGELLGSEPRHCKVIKRLGLREALSINYELPDWEAVKDYTRHFDIKKSGSDYQGNFLDFNMEMLRAAFKLPKGDPSYNKERWNGKAMSRIFSRPRNIGGKYCLDWLAPDYRHWEGPIRVVSELLLGRRRPSSVTGKIVWYFDTLHSAHKKEIVKRPDWARLMYDELTTELMLMKKHFLGVRDEKGANVPCFLGTAVTRILKYYRELDQISHDGTSDSTSNATQMSIDQPTNRPRRDRDGRAHGISNVSPFKKRRRHALDDGAEFFPLDNMASARPEIVSDLEQQVRAGQIQLGALEQKVREQEQTITDLEKRREEAITERNITVSRLEGEVNGLKNAQLANFAKIQTSLLDMHSGMKQHVQTTDGLRQTLQSALEDRVNNSELIDLQKALSNAEIALSASKEEQQLKEIEHQERMEEAMNDLTTQTAELDALKSRHQKAIEESDKRLGDIERLQRLLDELTKIHQTCQPNLDRVSQALKESELKYNTVNANLNRVLDSQEDAIARAATAKSDGGRGTGQETETRTGAGEISRAGPSTSTTPIAPRTRAKTTAGVPLISGPSSTAAVGRQSRASTSLSAPTKEEIAQGSRSALENIPESSHEDTREDSGDSKDSSNSDVAWWNHLPQEAPQASINGDFVAVLDPPRGHLNVVPKDHQRKGLAWMLHRESVSAGSPRGGLLADDQGMGKTLQAIMLILKVRPTGSCTLVVCPVAVMAQWKSEIDSKCTSQANLKCLIYHGPNRKNPSAPKFQDFGVVVTSYQTLAGEWNGDDKEPNAKESPCFSMSWSRVILDECQNIKNKNTKIALAVCKLKATARWCMTGTPLQNTIDDLYSFFRFLQYAPLETFQSFKNLKLKIRQNYQQGMESIRRHVQRMTLRRLKDILDLPPKISQVVSIGFAEDSHRKLYDNIMQKSLELWMEKQEGERKQGGAALALLMKCRQACVHPALAQGKKTATSAAQLKRTEQQMEGLRKAVNALDFDSKCQVCQAELLDDIYIAVTCKHVYCQGCGNEISNSSKEMPCLVQGCMKRTNLVSIDEVIGDVDVSSFARVDNQTLSSKIEAVLGYVQKLPPKSPQPRGIRRGVVATEKCIVFSQWTSSLTLLQERLESQGIKCEKLDGSMTTTARQAALLSFADDPEIQVLLISLMAGNCGLNIVAANHVVMLDLWWNPTVEDQAVDRVHRIGQTRVVRVVRFIIKDSIEERVLKLQAKKRSVSRSIFSVDIKDPPKYTLTNQEQAQKDMDYLLGRYDF